MIRLRPTPGTAATAATGVNDDTATDAIVTNTIEQAVTVATVEQRRSNSSSSSRLQ